MAKNRCFGCGNLYEDNRGFVWQSYDGVFFGPKFCSAKCAAETKEKHYFDIYYDIAKKEGVESESKLIEANKGVCPCCKKTYKREDQVMMNFSFLPNVTKALGIIDHKSGDDAFYNAADYPRMWSELVEELPDDMAFVSLSGEHQLFFCSESCMNYYLSKNPSDLIKWARGELEKVISGNIFSSNENFELFKTGIESDIKAIKDKM